MIAPKTLMLLPIKSKYAELILKGKKKWEFRKTKCKDGVNTILLYVSSPVKKVVGQVEIIRILEGRPREVYDCINDKNTMGITKQEYFNYYRESSKAVAYKLGEVVAYKEPVELSKYNIKHAPQLFMYVEVKQNEQRNIDIR